MGLRAQWAGAAMWQRLKRHSIVGFGACGDTKHLKQRECPTSCCNRHAQRARNRTVTLRL